MESVKLQALIKDLDVTVKGSKETVITGLSIDSRSVAPGNLFIAKKGLALDGADFIGKATLAGAAAILTDLYDPFLSIPQIIHKDPSSLVAAIASRYYGKPSSKLTVIGVTGTKGKTTSSYLIRHLLETANIPCGLAGTVETIVGDVRNPSHLTTHDVIANQKLLKEMVIAGCKAAVLEVSSHGLVQKRVDEIEFDLGVFTNLYPDHLDYHKTMEEYAAAKKILFQKAKRGIFNADSPWQMGEGLTYGIERGEVRAENIEYLPTHTEFTSVGTRFKTPLIGKFNVYNALAAICVGVELKIAPQVIQQALSSFTGVPGRMERVGNVFVDFAHTGEALANVLETVKAIAKGKVIVVFGAGGNRDPQRRVGMAQAADSFADVAIITTDNPRTEDPMQIAKEIALGLKKLKPLVELDRKKAIEQAIEMAGADDLVVIAGKGHQKEQIYANHTIPFDDLAVAKNCVSKIS